MGTIHLSWPSASGPQFWPLTSGPAEGVLTFAQRAAKFGKAKMQAATPTGCVNMKWCSSGNEMDEDCCPDPGPPPEEAPAFIARAGQWIYDQLIEFPATNDCTPPFPP